ncbi:MAG: ATP-binding protein [Flavobacteriales bacterium]
MKNQISSILSQIPNYNSKKYLLAVSGGLDSMVLMNLFHQLELDFAVAHCNFNLRAEESNLDEKLVKKVSDEYGKTCFVKQFDVNTYKEENGVSEPEGKKNSKKKRWQKVRLV